MVATFVFLYIQVTSWARIRILEDGEGILNVYGFFNFFKQ